MFRFQVAVGDEWVGDLTRDYYLHLGATVDLANTIPAPLVLDFPGWCVEAEWQMENKPWPILADTEPAPGLIYVTMEGMNDVVNATYPWNSWNHSSTDGPKGLTCDPELVMYGVSFWMCVCVCYVIDFRVLNATERALEVSLVFKSVQECSRESLGESLREILRESMRES